MIYVRRLKKKSILAFKAQMSPVYVYQAESWIFEPNSSWLTSAGDRSIFAMLEIFRRFLLEDDKNILESPDGATSLLKLALRSTAITEAHSDSKRMTTRRKCVMILQELFQSFDFSEGKENWYSEHIGTSIVYRHLMLESRLIQGWDRAYRQC
jgi:hypothetical protein